MIFVKELPKIPIVKVSSAPPCLSKKTMNGSIMGFEGYFSLKNVKKSNIIVVSYVGYQIQEISWTGGVLNIVLREDTEILNEEAIISYNTVRKADRTDSLAMPGQQKIQRPAYHQGYRYPLGVSVVSASRTATSPGRSAKIFVRRTNSISKSNQQQKQKQWNYFI